jgi:hypothetical protein
MSTEGDNKKKASSRKTSSRKKKTVLPDLSATNVDAPTKKILTKNLKMEEIIKEAFLRFNDTVTIKASKVKDLEHLDNIAEEFLQAYMILGYDLNGEKVFIMHANNPHDKDALVEHLRTTLLGIIGN